MEAVIFTGIQCSGKSTFFRQRFFRTHIRINLDMLKTRHREKILLRACLEAKQPFVVDNTNPTVEDRAAYIKAARSAGFAVKGYYFQSQIELCLAKNRDRSENERIPEPGVLGTYGKLEIPSTQEGFDELYYVSPSGDGGFLVSERADEV